MWKRNGNTKTFSQGGVLQCKWVAQSNKKEFNTKQEEQGQGRGSILTRDASNRA